MLTVAPTRVVLLNAVTAIGASAPFDASGYERVVFYIEGDGTLSAGTLLLEECDWNGGAVDPFAGTWSLLTTAVDLTTLSGVTGGQQVAIHLPSAQSYGFLRARISVAVTGGGSVTVTLRAN